MTEVIARALMAEHDTAQTATRKDAEATAPNPDPGRFVAERAVPDHVIDAFERKYERSFDLSRDDHEWRNTWRYKHDGIQMRWEGWRDGYLALSSAPTTEAPKPDPEIAELVERLRKSRALVEKMARDSEALSQAEQDIHDAIAALTASNDRVAELERENFALAANQCDGPKRGDDHGHEYCPIVEKLERERDEAIRQATIWFQTHTSHQEANATLGRANTQLFKRAYEAERRAEAAEAKVEKLTQERDEAVAIIKGTEALHNAGIPAADISVKVAKKMIARAKAAEAEVEKLREALRPLADAASSFDTMPIKDPEQWSLWSMKSNHPDFPSKEITVGDARRARAALSEKDHDNG